MASKTAKKTAMRPCEALLKLRPREVDRVALRAIVGTGAVGSYTELAAEFGVSEMTVRNNWAPNNMPGKGARRYKLLDVLCWRLERLNAIDASANAATSDVRDRRELAEAEKLELQGELLRMQCERERLEWVRVEDVQTAISTILRTASERLMQLPHAIAPSLPASVVGTVIPFLERKIGDTLRWIAEELGRKVAAPAEHNEHGGSQ